MSLTEKQSFYLSLIEQARAAGKSPKQVATENGVAPATLYNAELLRPESGHKTLNVVKRFKFNSR